MTKFFRSEKKMKNNLKSNIIFNLLAQFIYYATPLLIAPYVSRVLTPSGIGMYSYASSITFYFSSLILLGFSNYGINIISKNRNNKEVYSRYFWSIMFLRTIIGAALLLLFLVLSLCGIFGGEQYIYIFVAMMLVLIGNLFDIKFLFQGLENFRIIMFLQLIANILYMILIFTCVKSFDDLLLYTIFKSAIDLFVNFILILLSTNLLSKPKVFSNEFLNILKTSLMLFIPSILLTAGIQVNQTILGIFCDSEEVGFFQQAIKFPILIGNLIYALAPVVLARLSYLYKNGENDEIKDKVKKVIAMSFFISLPCCFGLYSICNLFVPLYFGETYTPVIKLLMIILPICIFSPISSLLINAYFYPLEKTKIVILISLVVLVANSILSIIGILVFDLGAVSACCATLICEFLLSLSLTICALKVIDIRFVFIDLLKVIISCVLMFFIIYIVNFYLNFLTSLWIILLDVILGAFMYSVFCLISKEFILVSFFKTIKNYLSRKM